jgi:thiol-disulfide isomerase/thioredoxin
MITSRIALIGLVAGASLSLCWGAAIAQQGVQDQRGVPQPKDSVPRAAVVGETLQSINDDYNRLLLQIEKQRLERLGQLAARQTPKDAAETYETLFRLAIANNLFAEAEPAAQRILATRSSLPPVLRFLAQTIKIIAAADRGDYDGSLADLRKNIGPGTELNRKAEAAAGLLDTPSMLAILGAYYQRLVQGDRFDVARKAFQLLRDETSNPALKEFCAARLNQLNMVGKAAPPIQGTDVDGKPVNLTDPKGSVVLVVFWASWCLPNAAEIAWLDQLYETYGNRGLRIVGINLDTLQSGEPKLEMVMPNIRRFLMDHNVRWPNLVNGEGAHDYAKAYGVTEIPSNVLIGPDGTVIHVDLSRKNLGPVIARALPKP